MKIYTTLDPDLQQAGLNAISIVPARVDYMNLGASGVQVEVGTGRILSMVQNRPYSIENSEDQNAPTTQVNYNVRLQNGGGGHSAGSTYKVFSLVNWLEQGHSVNETLNGRVGTKKVINCDGQTQDVVSATTATASATSRRTRATPERSTTSPATRSTRDSSRWRRRSRSARRTRSR
jgi:membrane peptidoglycan carboxypeptidase